MNWTPGIMVQAEDRVHRIGQVNSVNVYYLYGEKTLDQLIYPRLKLKSEVISNCLDGEEANFEIENTEKDDEHEEERKKYREAKEQRRKQRKEDSIRRHQQRVDKVCGDDEEVSFEQTNISDFFFQNTVNNNRKRMKISLPLPGAGLQGDPEQVDSSSSDSDRSWEELPSPTLKGIPEDQEKEECLIDIQQDDWEEGNEKKWRDYGQKRYRLKKIMKEEEWDSRDFRKRHFGNKNWNYKKKMGNKGYYRPARKNQLPAPQDPEDCNNMGHVARIENEIEEEKAIQENNKRLQKGLEHSMFDTTESNPQNFQKNSKTQQINQKDQFSGSYISKRSYYHNKNQTSNSQVLKVKDNNTNVDFVISLGEAAK